MSCVIGIKDKDGSVYIGADSAVVDVCYGAIDELPKGKGKVFENSGILFGVVGECRSMQVMQYNFSPPDRNIKETTQRYMHKSVIPALMQCLKDNSCAILEDNVLTVGCSVLIGYDGELFLMYRDFYAGYITEDFAAFGSGGQLALGAIATMLKWEERKNPIWMIEEALEVVCKHNAYCRAPFEILKVEPVHK